VGDSLTSDVNAARAFGMHAVWVCAHAHTLDDSELDRHADAVVSQTSDLEKVISFSDQR
jgi:FMN phosphatase YigB (HAD superfamily)